VTTDEIDGILSSEPGLEPSSGFVRAVMDAVHEDAGAPPLPFPWRRFALGVVACGAVAVAGTMAGPQLSAGLAALAQPLAPLAAVAPELGYAAIALVVSLAIARLPRLLARG